MSEEAEIQFKHQGVNYVVVAEYDIEKIDDSFDGHRAGYVYTFEAHHWEIDPDTINVISCIGGPDDQDEDVDPESVDGLMDTIIYELKDFHERHQ